MRCCARALAAVALAAMVFGMRPVPIGAWNDRGHMLVAFIAFRHLDEDVKPEVSRLLKLNPQYASWIGGLPKQAPEDRRTLIALQHASVWPDFIKGADGYVADGPNNGNSPPSGPAAAQNIGYADKNQHKYWHFINVPFSHDGTPTHEPPGVNARSEIELLRAALGSASSSDSVKSYDLVWLTHLVGDVHQPLHAIGRFTKLDPAGDNGGNNVTLNCVEWLHCEARLHGQWDGLLGRNAS